MTRLRSHDEFHSGMLWSAAVLLVALAALAFGVSSEASDDPLIRSDVAEAPSSSASGVGADQPPRYDVFMDHSVVNEHSTADESDQPGSSIAEWGP